MKYNRDNRLNHTIFNVIDRINQLGKDYKDKIKNPSEHKIEYDDINYFIHKYGVFQILTEYSVKGSYYINQTNGNNTVKLLCNADVNKSNLSIPFVKSSNGLILELNFNNLFKNTNTEKLKDSVSSNDEKLKNSFFNFNAKQNDFCYLVCYPSNLLNVNKNKREIQRIFLGSYYEVYKAEDGTLINLYYHNDKWNFSTRNSTNIEEIIWKNDKTYKNIIDDVFKTHHFDINQLNKNHCYTITIQHPLSHPFQSKQNLWFIQYAELDNRQINISRKLDDDIKGLSYPIKSNITLDKLIAESENSYRNFVMNGKKCYGYILRLKTSVDYSELHNKKLDSNYTDVYIESSLMDKLRKLLYNIPFIENKEARELEKKRYRDTDYISWISYLDISKKNIFKKLFTNYEEKYKIYDKIFRDTLNDLIAHINDNSINLTTEEKQIYDELNKNTSTDILKTIQDKNGLSESERRDILRDLLIKPEYAHIFYSIYKAN